VGCIFATTAAICLALVCLPSVPQR
jgi:hypothetical protein